MSDVALESNDDSDATTEYSLDNPHPKLIGFAIAQSNISS